MIPKIFHLFWHNGPISYLRHLTFVSLRHHHPDWKIYLHTSPKYKAVQWDYEQQDFNDQTCDMDYMNQVKDIVDEIRVYDKHPDKSPNFQSDFFRWDILHDIGGFYLDTDQIILKSFNDLVSYQFVYTMYDSYAPVGVVGAQPGVDVVQKIKAYLSQRYDPHDYNSIGPYMFLSALTLFSNEVSKIKSVNMGTSFYPVPYSHGVQKIYDGTCEITPDKYALHWFGGHPLSQKFNKQYKPNSHGHDTISKIVSHYIGGP